MSVSQPIKRELELHTSGTLTTFVHYYEDNIREVLLVSSSMTHQLFHILDFISDIYYSSYQIC